MNDVPSVSVPQAMFLVQRKVDPAQSAYLDIFRGASAILVLIGHAVQVFGDKRYYLLAGCVAQAAVMIFFVLSGFFIHKSIAKNFSGGSETGFAVARVNRILPSFVVSIGLIYALFLAAPFVFITGTQEFPVSVEGAKAFTMYGVLPTAVFVNGFYGETLLVNNPLWSLTFEIWYYFGIFLLAKIIIRREYGYALGMLWMAALVMANHAFLILALPWLLGVVASMLHANRRSLPYALPLQGLVALIAGIAIIKILVIGDTGKALTLWRLSVGFAMFFHLCHILTWNRIPQCRVLSSSAAYSYSLYIIHMPILLFAFGAIRSYVLGAVVACLVALAWAMAIGKRLERWRPFPERLDGRGIRLAR